MVEKAERIIELSLIMIIINSDWPTPIAQKYI